MKYLVIILFIFVRVFGSYLVKGIRYLIKKIKYLVKKSGNF